MPSDEITFEHHQHGKSRVRLGRVWRDGSRHHMVEWSVDIALLSKAEPSFRTADCGTIVATDTMKNTVYALAKEVPSAVSPEEFALKLARHFVSYYDVVTGAKVDITEKPWERVVVDGQPHDHGFKLGSEMHTVSVQMGSSLQYTVTAGIRDLSLLKTTQAGFEKFIRDKYTLLPNTRERIVASTVVATWTYTKDPASYTKTYGCVKEALLRTFFGPARGGVYSPSVQNTLFSMAAAVLQQFEEVESVYLNMPNLHFLPVNLPGIGVKFDNDVYLPTSEPHGSIEARLRRGQPAPLQARL
eukprot:jgi/Mesen1/4898/ME000244S04074